MRLLGILGGESSCTGHPQNFREIKQRFVVHIGKTRLDFGDAASTDVKAIWSLATKADWDQPSANRAPTALGRICGVSAGPIEE